MSIFSRISNWLKPRQTEQPPVMSGSLDDFLKGHPTTPDQKTVDAAKARVEAGKKYQQDMKLWLKYMQGGVFCIQPDINDYYKDPNYVWPRPNKPLPKDPTRPI